MKIRPAIRNLEKLRHQPDVTVVSMDGPHAISDKTLATYGAVACVWLAAHNAQTRLGLLGHFPAVSGDRGIRYARRAPDRYAGMERFAEAVKDIPELGPLDQTDIVLGGAVKEYNGGTFADMWFERRFAIATVGSVALDNHSFKTRWADYPNQTMSVKLDCPAGKLLIANSYRM